MNRVDLIRKLSAAGCELVRHGAKHAWCRNPATMATQAVPRHREIKERLAQHIIRMLDNPADDANAEGPEI